MIPLASAEYGYTYYFNPKSASSTYRSLFVELHRNELPAPACADVTIHNAFQYFHPMAIGGNSSNFSFSIVRHPFPRMVSAFLDKCVEINTLPERRFELQDHLQWIYRPIFEFLGRAPDFERGFSFIEFLQYLEQALRQRRPLDVHFQRQWNPSTTLDAFYRIEDPIENLLTIFRQVFGSDYHRLNLEQRLTDTAGNKLNRSFGEGPQATYSGAPIARLDFAALNKLLQQGYRFSHQSFMTPEAIELLSAVYADEMSAYHYSPDLDHPVQPL